MLRSPLRRRERPRSADVFDRKARKIRGGRIKRFVVPISRNLADRDAAVTEFGGEIVVGSRFLAQKCARVRYFSRKIGNRSLVDLGKLVSVGWRQHAEILCPAVRDSKMIYEVPIGHFGRSYAEAKKIRAHRVISIILMILRHRIFG